MISVLLDGFGAPLIRIMRTIKGRGLFRVIADYVVINVIPYSCVVLGLSTAPSGVC